MSRAPVRPPTLNVYEQSGQHVETAGRLWIPVTNLGIFGNPWYPFFGDEAGGEWPAGSGTEHLNYAALWVGARDAFGTVHVSTGFSAQEESEFRPGLGSLETIYRAYEGQPGAVRVGSAVDPDDDGDGLIDEEIQNGLDDDGDRLIDEDFAAASDLMLSCSYSDTTSASVQQNPDHVPLGLAVSQRIFAWSTPGLDDFVGFDFTITHTRADTLRDVYLGIEVDADIGPRGAAQFWTDDYTGLSQTQTSLAALNPDGVPADCQERQVDVDVAWMRDRLDPTPDEPAEPGTVRRPPKTPGYFGCILFTRVVDPVTGSSARVSFRSLKREQEANSDVDKYDLLAGASQSITDSSSGDWRMVVGVGPIARLGPGETVTLAGALVAAPTLPQLVSQAATAALAYEGRWVDADHDPLTGVDGRETCFAPGDPPILVNHDCVDSTRRVAVSGTSCAPANYINLDCDPCTPSVQGAETALHWAAPVNPPLPGILVGGPGSGAVTPGSSEQSVSIAWDNLPEVIPDPAEGRPLIEGYRIWKAVNWTRPPGSRGPSADLWMLVRDVSLKGDDPLAVPLASVTDTTVQSQEVLYGAPYYPVGRYRYVDAHVLPGVPYFYAVTPYRVVPGAYDTVKVARPPVATAEEIVVLSPPAQEDLSHIRIVPNPYDRRAGWDLTPSPTDPTGTKIGFFGLPRTQSSIKIYTPAGDLVQTIQHDGSGGNGGAYWDLRTRRGQDVASGIYLVVIESAGEIWKSRLVIIR